MVCRVYVWSEWRGKEGGEKCKHHIVPHHILSARCSYVLVQCMMVSCSHAMHLFFPDPSDPASWTLRIASRCYDASGTTPLTHASLTLTQLLSSFTCHIQDERYADARQMDVIQWDKATATVNTEGFEVSVRGWADMCMVWIGCTCYT